MNEENFNSKLNFFKSNEKPEVVLLVADDPKKIRVVVAWSNMNVKIRSEKLPLNGDSESEIWDWLWEHSEYSSGELLAKSDLKDFEVAKIFKLLVGNRIIYPDGTINSFVQRFLREKVLNLFISKARSNSKAKKTT